MFKNVDENNIYRELVSTLEFICDRIEHDNVVKTKDSFNNCGGSPSLEPSYLEPSYLEKMEMFNKELKENNSRLKKIVDKLNNIF